MEQYCLFLFLLLVGWLIKLIKLITPLFIHQKVINIHFHIKFNKIQQIICNLIDTMLGQQLRSNSVAQNQLFADWFNPSTGRRSYGKSTAQQNMQKGIQNIFNLFINNNLQSEKLFQDTFTFGVELQMWRKSKIKTVTVFIDQNRPNFVWFSSKTKAFLFDLTYTTVTRYNYELENACKVKDYIVLHYFQEEIDLIFRGYNSADAQKYFQLFSNYSLYNNLKHDYPPFFSRILKIYKMNNVEQTSISNQSISDVIKVSESVGFKHQQQIRNILRQIYLRNKHQTMTEKSLFSPMEVSQYFKIINCIEDLKSLFQQYSQYRFQNQLEYLQPVMSRQAFSQFLLNEQQQKQDFIAEILSETHQFISFYDFCTYLSSQKSNYVAGCDPINQNLPLTDYFCFSSHNTYLSGNQLTSDSKIERFIEDLQNGIKCVEMDVHNDGNIPIINHAFKDKSFCKPIDFEQTIKEIASFSQQHPNHYPIIISLQNHANDQNKYKMLDIFLKYMKDQLYTIHSQKDSQTHKVCKTLKELRGKIILKSDSKLAEVLAFKNKSNPPTSKVMTLPLSLPSMRFPLSHFQNKYESFQKHSRYLQTRKNQFQLTLPKSLYLPLQQISKVTGMFKSQGGINNAASTGYESTSVNCQDLQKQNLEKIVEYSKRSWLRVYPLGAEISSNNYNPVPSLRLGAQIIALNTQTKDNYAWLLRSYFTAGRQKNTINLGYVEKPLHLRSNQPRVKTMTEYHIKILTLLESVSIKFYGADTDMKLNEYATTSFNVKYHNQGFLMFKIGQKFKQCVPLRFMRSGFRVLVAKNEMYRDSGQRVLIHTTIKQYRLG